MAQAQLSQIQPVRPTRDVTSAINFYVEKLGFKLAFQDADPPCYAGVMTAGLETDRSLGSGKHILPEE
jgi:catechol 2,3-dioxygenase-like lactoylglutathione lyase family enzyme